MRDTETPTAITFAPMRYLAMRPPTTIRVNRRLLTVAAIRCGSFLRVNRDAISPSIFFLVGRRTSNRRSR